MPQNPAWTQDVSERLIDLQIHAERMIDADGVRTPAEEALIEEFKACQGVIQEVEDELMVEVRRTKAIADELVMVASAIRTGRAPRRLRPLTTEPDAA